jgi:chlorite dismutase
LITPEGFAMTEETKREAPGLPEIDVREWGGKKDGEKQVLDRRLFMQLLVLDVDRGEAFASVRDRVVHELGRAKVPHVVYEDANATRGLGVLTWSDDPVMFVAQVHPALREVPMSQRDGWTMLGRTYSLGHEPELEHALLRRPVEYALNDAWNWHVWYPLRRSGAFEKLDKHTQSTILREHASIGMAYGRADLAHDVRLACHGLDARDNEFVIGLIGKDLHPLSHIVQTMRHTQQTSEFIVQMGPFFVGRVVHRSAGA